MASGSTSRHQDSAQPGKNLRNQSRPTPRTVDPFQGKNCLNRPVRDVSGEACSPPPPFFATGSFRPFSAKSVAIGFGAGSQGPVDN